MNIDDFEGGFAVGVVAGVIFAAFFFTVFWHIGESNCQTENNVADCRAVFVPVEKDQPND